MRLPLFLPRLAIALCFAACSPAAIAQSLGDLNGDGQFNDADLNVLPPCIQSASAPVVAGCEQADMNGDGSLDAFDFLAMQTAVAGPAGTCTAWLVNGLRDARYVRVRQTGLTTDVTGIQGFLDIHPLLACPFAGPGTVKSTVSVWFGVGRQGGTPLARSAQIGYVVGNPGVVARDGTPYPPTPTTYTEVYTSLTATGPANYVIAFWPGPDQFALGPWFFSEALISTATGTWQFAIADEFLGVVATPSITMARWSVPGDGIYASAEFHAVEDRCPGSPFGGEFNFSGMAFRQFFGAQAQWGSTTFVGSDTQSQMPAYGMNLLAPDTFQVWDWRP